MFVLVGTMHADGFLERKMNTSAPRKLRRQENNRVEIDLQSTEPTEGDRHARQNSGSSSMSRAKPYLRGEPRRAQAVHSPCPGSRTRSLGQQIGWCRSGYGPKNNGPHPGSPSPRDRHQPRRPWESLGHLPRYLPIGKNRSRSLGIKGLASLRRATR